MAFAPNQLKFTKFEVEAVTSTRLEQSPYSFVQVAYDFQGDLWKVSADLAPVPRADAAALEAWFLGLGGVMGSFQLYWPRYGGPFGSVESDGFVSVAASARAATVSIQHGALATGGFGALVAGDKITIGQSLHVITAADPVGGSGVQVVQIWPRLRSDATALDPVAMVQPFGTWRMAAPSMKWAEELSAGRVQSVQLVEARG